MSPEIELMEYLSTITGIPISAFIERDSNTGQILEKDNPYAIIGDVRVNHQQALNGDYVMGGFSISGFFNKRDGRLAEEWAEFMRRKLLRTSISFGEYTYTFNTVRKQVRKDVTTMSITHRATITVTFERSNEKVSE